MAHTYQLSARMEGGEVSELYRGLQDHNREVTLKLFSPRFSDPEYGRVLAQASKQVGGLGHTSILHYEDLGVTQGRLCAVRAYLDGYHLGTALGRLATKEVVLPGPVALQIGVEVMLALGAAHQAGLVHGALTPANIFVTREGRVFVTDFMALWAMRQSPPLRALAERGRQAYRAPEVGKGNEPDPAADVYSVAAILYELLTLREVAGARAGGVSTRRDALTPPSRLSRNVNARLDPLILRALEPLKSRRHKNCLEMAEAFQAQMAVMGGIPGRIEIGKFVNELFPNEVQLAGSGGALPLAGEFELEALAEGLSLPGLKVDVAERVSYSAPALDFADLPEIRVSDKTVHEEEVTDPPPAPRKVSDWEAPPGALDPAVERKVLSSPRMAPLTVDETQPLPVRETESARRRKPVENFTAVQSTTDVTTNPESAKKLLAEPGATATDVAPPPSPGTSAGKMRVARPRKELPEEPRREEKPDWHAKPPPPRRRAPVKTSVGAWAIALVMSFFAALLTYLAATHKVERAPEPPRHVEPPPPKPVVPEPAVVAPAPAPTPAPKEPVHKPAPPPKPKSFCLTVETDLRPAFLSIDGAKFIALPVKDLPVGPGKHKLVAKSGSHVVRDEVDESLTQTPCYPKTILFRHQKR